MDVKNIDKNQSSKPQYGRQIVEAPAPTIYVTYGENGMQCGILNLHTDIKAAWAKFDPYMLYEHQKGLKIKEEVLSSGNVGHVLQSTEDTLRGKGQVINLAWINGNEVSMRNFKKNLSEGIEMYFNAPLASNELGRFSC